MADPWQATVLRSRERFMLLNVARQLGKSTATAILALHEALFAPRRPLILMLGPAERQSSELFRKVLDSVYMLGSEMIDRTEESKTFLTLSTGSRIVALPGVAETIRGFSGASTVIVDEAARVDDQLFTALLPMIAQSGGRLLLLSTPAGKQGFFYRSWVDKGERWERHFVPASACTRIAPSELEWQRAHMTANDYLQEFQGEFISPAGAALDPEVIHDMFSTEVAPMFPPVIAASRAVRVIDEEVKVLG